MVKFAVIGVGGMGKRHAFNLYHGLIQGAKLEAIVDIDDAAIDWSKKHLKKVKAYKSIDELIQSKSVDAALIVTPHYSHKELAIKCIEAGIHTLIEKPMCVTTSDSQEVIDVAKKHPEVKVGVSFNQRSNKMYIKAKELLEDGTMGDIQRVDYIITNWYRSQAYYNQGGWRASYKGEGGGCLINQCVHQLDILQWLVGMPKKVFTKAYTIDRDITTEDDVTCILDYGDYRGSFSASTHEIKGINRLEIACDKGRIVITSNKMVWYTHKSQKQVNRETEKGYGFTKSKRHIKTYGLLHGIKDLVIGQQARSIKAFVSDIAGKGKMLAGIEDGYNTTMLFNSMYLSNWKRQEIELPIDGDEYNTYLENKIKNE